MNMFARFDENSAMTLRGIKETKRYGRTDGRTDGHTDGRTDGQRENSIPPTNKVCGGIIILAILLESHPRTVCIQLIFDPAE